MASNKNVNQNIFFGAYKNKYNSVNTIDYVCVSCLVMSDSLQPHRLVAHPAPLSMGFSRQEHRSALPFPSPKGTTERKKVKSLSHVQLFAIPWTVAYQASLSGEFSRQEYWSGLPFPSPSLTVAYINQNQICSSPGT